MQTSKDGDVQVTQDNSMLHDPLNGALSDHFSDFYDDLKPEHEYSPGFWKENISSEEKVLDENGIIQPEITIGTQLTNTSSPLVNTLKPPGELNISNYPMSPVLRSDNEETLGHDAYLVDAERFPNLLQSASTSFLLASDASDIPNFKDVVNPQSQETPLLTDDQSSPLSSMTYVQNPEKTYIELVPLINSLNPINFCELLVETLRLCLHQVPLDDFFDLLYGDEMPDLIMTNGNDSKVDKSERSFKMEGLKLCYFILRTLRFPGVEVGAFAIGLIDNKRLFRIRFSEVRRNFLAIKIAFDSLLEYRGAFKSINGLSRQVVKHAYSIVCQKLLSKHLSFPSTLTCKNVMVGELKFGKIIKMVYPNLIIRRIGRRGYSSYHYFGLQWNDFIIDDKMIRILEKENPPSIMSIRSLPKARSKENLSILCTGESGGTEDTTYGSGIHCVLSLKSPKRSRYSFIDMATKFPKQYCFPIAGEFPGRIPKHSEWARKVMMNSADTLKKFNVDVGPLINNFNVNILSPGIQNHLLFSFLQEMAILLGQLFPEESYLHLFLVVLLLIFPVCLASKEEVSCQRMLQFRKHLNNFISHLQSDVEILLACDSNYLLIFMNIIRNMMRLTLLSESYVKTTLVKSITEEMFRDFNLLKCDQDISLQLSEGNEALVVESIVMATKALNCDFFDDELKAGPKETNDILLTISRAISEYLDAVTESIGMVSESMTEDDLAQKFYNLPFQICKALIILFHNHIKASELLLQLPISFTTYVLCHIHKEMHNISFNYFGKRDHDVSKETFKTWWVFSGMATEYFSIFSEIVSLSERLSNS